MGDSPHIAQSSHKQFLIITNNYQSGKGSQCEMLPIHSLHGRWAPSSSTLCSVQDSNICSSLYHQLSFTVFTYDSSFPTSPTYSHHLHWITHLYYQLTYSAPFVNWYTSAQDFPHNSDNESGEQVTAPSCTRMSLGLSNNAFKMWSDQSHV